MVSSGHAVDASREQFRQFRAGKNKALFDAGKLAKCDEGRYKTKVSVEGQRIPVICLAVSNVMDKEETELEPSDEDKPQKFKTPF